MLLSRRDYAKHRGVSDTAVRKAIESGRITLVNDKIDPDKADKEWDKNTNPAYNPNKADTTSSRSAPALHEIKAQLLLADLQLKRMDVDERKGKSLNADEVHREAFEVTRLSREKLLSTPRKFIPLCMKEKDPEKQIKIAEDHIRKALFDLTEFLSGTKSG